MATTLSSNVATADNNRSLSLGQSITIPIHFPDDNDKNDGPPEWAMIEINGELVVPRDIDGDDDETNDFVADHEFELGSIRFDGETPIMVLGSHELIGTTEVLKQPFCVFQKILPSTMKGVTDDDMDDDVTSIHTNNNSSGVSYQVQGVVTRKILFNKYPKVIMRAVQ